MPKLRIDIEAVLANFNDGMNRVERQAASTGKKLESAFSGFSTLLKTIGVAFGAREAAGLLKNIADLEDGFLKMSSKVGASVEALSALKYAGELSDASIETLNTGLRQIAKNAQDAQAGTGDAKDAFAALGISVTDANGKLKGTETLILEVADKFAEMEDSSGKTALAMRLFGRAGTELIPLLNEGSKGIKAMAEEGRSFGVVLTKEDAKAAQEFNDNLTRLQAAATGFARVLAGPLFTALNKAADEMMRARKEGEGFWGVLIRGWQGLATGNDADKLNKQMTELGNKLASLWRWEKELATGPRTEQKNNLLKQVRQDIKDTEEEMRKLIKLRPILTGEDEGTGKPKKSAPKLRTAQDIADDLKADQLILSALIAGEVEAAQGIQDFNESMIDTWDGFGERIQVTTAEFEKMTKAAEEGQALINQVMIQSEVESAQAQQDMADNLVYTWDKAGNRITIARDKWDELNKKAQETTNWAKELGLTFESAFEDAIVGGKSLRDILQGIEQDILRILIRKKVTEPFLSSLFGEGSGGGGLLDKFGGFIKDLFHFASGGSFTVGGSGGTDSKFVGFMATPGERVTVTPPGQAGASMHVEVNTVVQAGAGTTSADADVIASRTSSAVEGAVRAVLIKEMRNGGLLAGAH